MKDKSNVLASPGLMAIEQAKQCMPPTSIVTADNDALKKQGEDLAKLLQSAGVECGIVQAMGSVHDVEIFNIARESATAKMVMVMISGVLVQVLKS